MLRLAKSTVGDTARLRAAEAMLYCKPESVSSLVVLALGGGGGGEGREREGEGE